MEMPTCGILNLPSPNIEATTMKREERWGQKME